MTDDKLCAALLRDAEEIAGWGAGNEAINVRLAAFRIRELAAILKRLEARLWPRR